MSRTSRTGTGRLAGVSATIVGRLACALLAGACLESGSGDDANGGTAPHCPDRIRDTLGDEYALDCDDLGAPFAERQTPTCRGDETLFFALHPSQRLLRICRFEGDPEGFASVAAEHCRPSACTTSADCPSPYACRSGVCQIASRPVTGKDALVLCLSDIAWPAPCSSIAIDPVVSQRVAALEACLEDDDAPCQVPSICKQP